MDSQPRLTESLSGPFAAVGEGAKASLQVLHRIGHRGRGDVEVGEQLLGRRRRAETVETNHRTVETDILAPVRSYARLDCDAFATPSR